MASPDVNLYMVGKGKLYFDRWTSADGSTGERDLGNAPSFMVTPNVVPLDHFSSRTGIRSKDLSIDVEQSLNVKFSLDEISAENLALALCGDGVEAMSQGDGNVGAEAITLYTDRWVKLANRNISVSSVGIAGYVEGTDYTVDHPIGRIRALSTGGIADGEAVNVSYTFGAMTWDFVEIFGRKPVQGLLRLVGTGQVGEQYEILLHKVKIKNSGDISFIGDDWNVIELEGEVLDDTENHPADPFGKIIVAGVDISNS